jgi:phosphatidylserine/phosphatidylglycerophosphate/cardiolipin synthase-like enzyme
VEWWLGGIGGLFVSEYTHQNIRAVTNLRFGLGITSKRIDGRVLMDWGGRADSRHEKSTIIYSSTTHELRAFIGGMDYAPDRMANELHTTPAPLPWHDVGVELRGGAAMAVLKNFQTRWTETATLPSEHYWMDGGKWVFNSFVETPPPSQPTTVAPPVISAGAYAGSSVRILRSYEGIRAFSPWKNLKNLPWSTLPPAGIQEIQSALRQAILEATDYIYVEDQTLNRGIIEETYIKHHILYPIISVALARGVKVIFVSQGKAGPSEMPVSFTMSNQIRDEILAPLNSAQRENFALYLIADTKVHSKVVLVDDEFASIGSANFWDRSMTGTESELNAAIVHPGGQNSLIADLRVRLWRGHLRVASNAGVDAELRDLRKSLGIWRSTWGWGITFPHPDSALREVTP